MNTTSLSCWATVIIGLAASVAPSASLACGGFFCTTVPINQAAEQIVFRQEGATVTAMVRILYSGNAEDFSWVIPVPDTPDISIGADATFDDLNFATQPQFNLNVNGEICPQDQPVFAFPESVADSAGGDGSVVVEEQLSLGPFNFEVIRSDNPDDMAMWLADNNYLVTERGNSLIAPYVNAGMKFVAVKLKSGESSGSIQPIILKYPSEKPMVPIRLTAIAAEDDMGVLVWVVNDQLGRAIPENYKHVVPNYTKLDWFSGFGNAYGSYQDLITDAMNESGGQGFATDFAGTIGSDITNNLRDTATFENTLLQLDAIPRDADYVVSAVSFSLNPRGATNALQTVLPLPDGLDNSVYFFADELERVFTPDELSKARADLKNYLINRDLEPLANSVELIPFGGYMTRLYTTLSADEMTVDPTFNYNANMPDQSRTREAQVNASCVDEVSNWTLTLGAGTEREGEVVMDVTGEPIPFFGLPIPEPIAAQPATFKRQRTFADAEPITEFSANLTPLVVSADGSFFGGVGDASGGSTNSSSSSFFGTSGLATLLGLSVLVWVRTWVRVQGRRKNAFKPS